MLDHTLHTGLAAQQQGNWQRPSYNNNQNYNQQYTTQSPYYTQQQYTTQSPFYQTRPQPTRPPTSSSSESSPSNSEEEEEGEEDNSEQLTEFSSQCGIPKYKRRDSTGLVVNGRTAFKGQVRRREKILSVHEIKIKLFLSVSLACRLLS